MNTFKPGVEAQLTANLTIKSFIDNIQKAFCDRICQLWLDCFAYEDDMSLSAEKDWFEGYLMNDDLASTEVEWHEVYFSSEEDIYRVSCRITCYYKYYNTHMELHQYLIKKNEESGKWYIAIINKKRQAFAGAFDRVASYRFTKITQEYCTLDWPDAALLRRLSSLEDLGQVSLYARAIPRNIRYRQAHPTIECASLRANMLSSYVAKTVVDNYEDDPKNFAMKLYNAVRDSVMLCIERNDRNNSWSSKFQAPWQGIDELMETNVHDGKLTCSCSSYMSYLHSAFRLGGFACDDVLQVRLKTQDILIIFIEETPFLIDTERVLCVTDRMLFHYAKASVIYTDEWVWTVEGITNLPLERRRKIKQRIKKVPFIQFPFLVNADIDVPKPAAPFEMPKLPLNFFEYHQALLLQVLQNYCRHTDSVDAWTLYAYQTWFVKKPEVYMNWSIQSQIVRQQAFSMRNPEAIISFLSSIGDGSIFVESHRIMTSDQVLKTGRGDTPAKALLMAVLFKLANGYETAVLITTQTAYCLLQSPNGIRCQEMPTGHEASAIIGLPLILFNENSSVKFELENKKTFTMQNLYKSFFKLINSQGA